MKRDNKDLDPLIYDTYQTALARLKVKDKKMYRLVNRAGYKFQLAMLKYQALLVRHEQVQKTNNYTRLFGLWEKRQ